MLQKPCSPKDRSPATSTDTSSSADGKTDQEFTATKLIDLPRRPNVGIGGDVMSLETNHFPMNINKLGDIFVYTIEVKSNYKLKEIRDKNNQVVQRKVKATPTPRRWRRILWILLHQTAELASSATDYDRKLVSVKALAENEGALTWDVDLYEDGEQVPGPAGRKRTFTVTLTYAKRLQADVFRSADPNIEAGFREEFLNALNLLLSRKPNQSGNIVAIGKTRLFDTSTPNGRRRRLGDGHTTNGSLQAYFGFDRSVRSAAEGLLFQLNVSAAAFYPAVRLDQVINAWSKGSNSTALEAYQDRHYAELEQFIRGLRVRAAYGTNRVYSVWGLSTADSPVGARPTVNTVRFDWVHIDSKGVITSTTRPTIREYLDQEYLRPAAGRRSDDKARPVNANALVINVGTADHEISISSEKLIVLEGNSYRRLLKPEQTGSMVRFAARGPLQTTYNPLPPRDDIFQNGLPMFGIADNVNGEPADGPMRTFQIEVTGRMLNVDGRRLRLPSLRCIEPKKDGDIVRYVGKEAKDQFQLQEFQPRSSKADWLMNNRYFLEVPKAPKWTCIEFGDDAGKFCNTAEFEMFVKELVDFMREYCSTQQACAQLYELAQRQFRFSDPKTYTDALKTMVEKHYDIVFVVLPSKDATNYETLKHLADCTVGIHTICIVKYPNWRPGLQNKGRDVREIKQDADNLTNLMLKCNLKLGGTNTALAYDPHDDEVRRLSSSTTMIVGADVTHPGPGSMNDCPSIAAVVASVDDMFNQYPASFHVQESKKEMIDGLGDMLVERLEHWKANNGDGNLYPEQVLFYRDGVSEGQYQQILIDELPQITAAFRRTCGNAKQALPKLLLVCVVKRTATRFYTTSGGRGLKAGDEDLNGNPPPGLVVDTRVVHAHDYDWYAQSHHGLQGTAKPTHYVVLVDQIGASPDALQKATFWHCFLFARSTKPISVHPAARLADRACNRARAYLREYLVAGDRCGETFDRTVNARHAWIAGVHPHLRNSMFYI